MAVITVAQLAPAIRVGSSADELAQVTRLLAFAQAQIDGFAKDVPEAIRNEAIVRLVGYLYDAPNTGYANALTNSGAASMLLPYRVQRAGRVAGETTSSGGGGGGGGTPTPAGGSIATWLITWGWRESDGTQGELIVDYEVNDGHVHIDYKDRTDQSELAYFILQEGLGVAHIDILGLQPGLKFAQVGSTQEWRANVAGITPINIIVYPSGLQPASGGGGGGGGGESGVDATARAEAATAQATADTAVAAAAAADAKAVTADSKATAAQGSATQALERGLPSGGKANQILKKSSSTDYAAEWTSQGDGNLPAGGGKGQVLTKQTGDDFDVDWATATAVDQTARDTADRALTSAGAAVTAANTAKMDSATARTTAEGAAAAAATAKTAADGAKNTADAATTAAATANTAADTAQAKADTNATLATSRDPNAGGAKGQVLAKKSATDYDYEWVTPSAATVALKKLDVTFARSSSFNHVIEPTDAANNTKLYNAIKAGGVFMLAVYADSKTENPLLTDWLIVAASSNTDAYRKQIPYEQRNVNQLLSVELAISSSVNGTGIIGFTRTSATARAARNWGVNARVEIWQL